MIRSEFESLWRAEKTIIEDVIFKTAKGIPSLYIVEEIEIFGVDGLFANLSYDCSYGGMVCNFIVKGVGAVHRYCIGATIHGDAGRYHEHQIESGSCVRQGLPNVVGRDDLKELNNEERWRKVCQEANITFTGVFYDPELQC